MRLDVFSDYLRPWRYSAAERLHTLQRTCGERMRVHWRTFPLIPDQRLGRRCTPQTRESRRRVAAEEPRAPFILPPVDSELLASSILALTGAKSAERQGETALAVIHDALFATHFRDNLDIGRPNVLWHLDRDCGLDLASFRRVTSVESPTKLYCTAMPRAPPGLEHRPCRW